MTRGALIATLAALGSLGLAACEEGAARRGGGAASSGGGLCKPFSDGADAQAAAPGMPGQMAMNGAVALEDCLHRWGYTLAKSEEDAADVVADAVVAACAAPLARWNQQSLSMAVGSDGQRASLEEAPSLLTGQPTNPILEHNHFAQSRALFYVVQARAGDCDPPRVDARRDRDDDRAAAPAYSPNSPDR